MCVGPVHHEITLGTPRPNEWRERMCTSNDTNNAYLPKSNKRVRQAVSTPFESYTVRGVESTTHKSRRKGTST